MPFSDDVSDRRFQQLTCPRQRPYLGVRRLARRRYPAGYTKTSMKEPSVCSRFPVAFRPPALASWASCARPRISFPYGRLTPPNQRGPDGVSTFPTSEIRPGWAPSLLRDGGALTAGRSSPAAACRFPAASPLPRCCLPSPRLPMTKHSRIHFHSPVRSSPCLWPPDGAGSLGLLPQASNPAVTSDAR